jgi:hypothetical protein
MSRTNKSTSLPKNPAKRFLEWKSVKKTWNYYDKDKAEEVSIPHDKLMFIVLDQLNTVKGYDRRKKQGMWSNEVRNVTKEPLTVRWSDGIVAEGLYKDIKARENRIKFCKSVYVMAKVDGEYELCNLQLTGQAMSNWIDFTKASGDVEGNLVVSVVELIEDAVDGKPFWSPKFGVVSRSLSPEASKTADELDGVLQDYLKVYFAGQAATSGGTSEHEAQEVSREATEDRGRDALSEIESQLDEHLSSEVLEEEPPF